MSRLFQGEARRKAGRKAEKSTLGGGLVLKAENIRRPLVFKIKFSGGLIAVFVHHEHLEAAFHDEVNMLADVALPQKELVALGPLLGEIFEHGVEVVGWFAQPFNDVLAQVVFHQLAFFDLLIFSL